VTARTPAQIADAAAEEIRALNHALYADIAQPSDAYSIVGNLSHLASMLPQALTMIRGAVQELEREGGLYSDRGTLADDLARAYDGLEQAAADAQTLHRAITRAHAGLSHIWTHVGGEEG
jgi:hypothetical protein